MVSNNNGRIQNKNNSNDANEMKCLFILPTQLNSKSGNFVWAAILYSYKTTLSFQGSFSSDFTIASKMSLKASITFSAFSFASGKGKKRVFVSVFLYLFHLQACLEIFPLVSLREQLFGKVGVVCSLNSPGQRTYCTIVIFLRLQSFL